MAYILIHEFLSHMKSAPANFSFSKISKDLMSLQLVSLKDGNGKLKAPNVLR